MLVSALPQMPALRNFSFNVHVMKVLPRTLFSTFGLLERVALSLRVIGHNIEVITNHRMVSRRPRRVYIQGGEYWTIWDMYLLASVVLSCMTGLLLC